MQQRQPAAKTVVRIPINPRARIGTMAPPANDAGKVYFIEILTWKDHDKPDNAPPEVTSIWAQMEALCERRDGHRGIEFYEVRVIRR